MGDTHELTLPDGRRMTYADYGDPAGPVVLECVGTPQSRLPFPGQAELPAAMGFRVLVPDRPGVGGSDPQLGRTLTDWPADAAALMDALGVDRFGVLGGSGGGPYAVACGVLLADRVTAVALVAPAAPATAPAHGFVPSADPAALRERGETIARLLDEGLDALEAFFAPDLSDSDRGQHTDPSELENLREFFRQGVDAYVEDHTINGSDWAYLLPRLTRPTRVWQGDDDNNVPAEATRWLAEQIPGAELTLVSGAGHSFADDAFRDVYAWLLAATTSTSKPSGSAR
ncbi:MAG TPA: alpha/beta hydrolase [Mycobacteriales bacterium]